MSLKKLALKGFIWTYLEQSGGQIINFFVNILLARTLFPSDFGVLGLLFIFITISNVLVDGGMAISIIRKKDATEKDYSSVFFANILFSIALYGFIYLIAPYISEFYNKPELIHLVRVFSLTIPLQGFVVVQSAILTKNLNFKQQTLMKLPSIILSSAIGISLALLHYGVWSLVWMYLTQTFFWALFHWVFSDWKPKLALFDRALFKSHFNFGYKLSITEIFNALIANIYQIVIGKYYNVLYVGYYTQSLTLRQLPISNIYGSASKLFLPIFSKIQGDDEKLIKTYKQILYILIVVIAPFLTFLAIFSEQIIVFIYSEKWRVAAPFLFHLTIAGIFGVVCNFNLSVLKIIGESKLILKIEFLNKLQTLFFILVTVFFGFSIQYLLYTISISALVSYLIIIFFAAPYLKQKKFDLLFIPFRLLTISFSSAFVSYFLYTSCFQSIFILFINFSLSVLIGLMLYITLIFVFDRIIITNMIKILKNEE
jgi:O-antigen/teichoic acid export membrane protein